MKLKIILSIIVIIFAGTFALVLWRSGNIKPSLSSQKIHCPEIPFSFKPSSIPQSPMRSRLCLLEKPILDKPVTLLYKFKSASPATNITAKIELPQSFVLVRGNPEWRGNLVENQEQSFEIVIKSTKVGYHRLEASVLSKGEGFEFGHADTIDLEITSGDAILDSKPKNNWYKDTRDFPIPGQPGGEILIKDLIESIIEDDEAIDGQLMISNTPELNKEFTITFRAAPKIDLTIQQGTQMSLVFPSEAFKLLKVEFPPGGETFKSESEANSTKGLYWNGGIKANQTVEIRATFQVVNVGYGLVSGTLFSGGVGYEGLPPSEITQETKFAYLYVDKYGGYFFTK